MSYEELRITLEKYGLSHNEAKVYLTLLSLGSAMAGKISKEAMIDRTSCYDALKKLLKKGLVSYAVEANRKMFKAISPDRLVGFLKEKEEEINEIMPQLKGMYKPERESIMLHYSKGIKE